MTVVCSSVLYVHTAYYFTLSNFIQITNEIGTDFDQFFWHTSTILIYEGWNFTSGNYLFTSDTK